MANIISVLTVDDDRATVDLTATYLERNDGFSVTTATGPDEALDRIRDRPPDCVVSDYEMPGMNGLELFDVVHEEFPTLPFILYTGKGSEAVAGRAVSAGVTDYLQKQSGAEQYDLLANRIRNAVQARRETERANRQEQLMRLTEFAGDTGGFEVDIGTGEMLLTVGARRLTGIDQESVPAEEILELHPPDERAEVRESLEQAAETGEQIQGVWGYQPRGGESGIIEVNITPVTEDGETALLQGAVRDITEQQEREEELRAERRFSQQALDAVQDVFYVLDLDGTLRRWNDRVRDVTGYTAAELAGMDALGMFPEDEHEALSEAIEETLVEGQATVRADMLTTEGRTAYEFVGSRLTDPDGHTTGLVGIGRDLAEREHAD